MRQLTTSTRRLAAVFLPIFGLIAAFTGAAVGWMQVGGPIPATRFYVDSADAVIIADQQSLRETVRDTRLLVLYSRLNLIQRETIQLEAKDGLTRAEIRLKIQLSEEERTLERQINRLLHPGGG